MSYTQRVALSSLSNGQRMSMGPPKRQAAPGQRRKTMAAQPKPTQKSMLSKSGRQTSFGAHAKGRMSSVGGARKSMAMRGAAGVKDPRPLGDRQYMMLGIKMLIDFLQSNGYSASAVNPKVLSAPTSKDFMLILQFLYRQIDPNFTFSKASYQEDVPLLFKSLGYPFPISKRALSAVGSPHSWPALLGALTWLVELLTYAQVAAEHEEAAGGVGGAQAAGGDIMAGENAEKLFFAYLQKAYSSFLSGTDDYGELDADLGQQFASRNSEVEGEIASLEASCKKLEDHIRALEESPNSLAKMQKKAATLGEDVKKFEALIGRLDECVARQQKSIDEHRATLQSKSERAGELQAERDELQARIARQEVSPADVARMNGELTALQHTVSALEAEQEEIQKSVWEKECQIEKRSKALESALATYHAEARRLEFIPSNAQNAHGFDFQVAFNMHAQAAAKMLAPDVEGAVRPAMQRAVRAQTEAAAELRRTAMRLQAEISRAAEEHRERSAELERMRTAVERGEQTHEHEQAVMQQEMTSLRREIERVDEEMRALQEEQSGAQAVQDTEVADAQQRLTQVCEQHAAEREQLQAEVTECLDALTAHKEYITNSLAALQEEYDASIESMPSLAS